MVTTKEELEKMVLTLLKSPEIVIGDANITVEIGHGHSIGVMIYNAKEDQKYYVGFPTIDHAKDPMQQISFEVLLKMVRLAVNLAIVTAECATGLKAELVDPNNAAMLDQEGGI